MLHSVSVSDSSSSTGSESKVTARKVGESVTTALDVMATAINYPIGKLYLTNYFYTRSNRK